MTLACGLPAGLTLTMALPGKALESVDPGTGQTVPSGTPLLITIRDHDEDGMPDDFKLGGAWPMPLDGETVTDDGFVRFRASSDHGFVWAQWWTGVGFSVNHFLHGIDSALPRE